MMSAPQSLHFLFPSHPLRGGIVEEIFADQYSAFEAAGFSVSLVSDAALRDSRPLRGIAPDSTVVYRGWMLNERDYTTLASLISAAGATAMTSRDEYLSAHHLPRWYPLVAEFTAETHVLPLNADLESELRGLGWGGFFIKDYVKSLKTARGAIVHDPGEIHDLVAEMQAFLGEIEGGLCVRRVEAYKPDTERRYFVLRHQAYAATDDAIPSIVRHVAAKIPSDFFSVDVAERDDGELRVIEIGDGQVSDLVGWTTNRFVEIWKSQTD